MPTISVNEVELYYQEAGAGYPLVLLHGLGSSGEDWLFQTPVFAEHFRVIAPNLRGHKLSSRVRGPITIHTLAADVAKLLAALEIDTAHVLGLSLGGLVAQTLAIDFPEKVNQLVLVNTFAHLRPTSLRETYTLARRVVVSRFFPINTAARVVAHDLFPKPEQAPIRQVVLDRVGTNDATSYRHVVDAIRRFDTRRQLHQIRQSTLLITGDRDGVVPRSCQQQLVRSIPKVRWKIVRDSGHVTPIDQPEEFNRIVLEFLGEV